MMRILAVGLLALGAQDGGLDRQIRRHLDALGSDSVVERDEAAEALVRIGPPALPALRKVLDASAGELRARAEGAIRGIERERAIAELNRAPRPITIRLQDAPLPEIARALGVEADPALAGRTLSLDVEEAGLLESLDRLCAGAKTLTYERTDAGGILLKPGPHPACPAAYAGGFRLRVTNLQASRRQTYLAHEVALQLTLEADHDPSVRPLPNAHILIEEAVDDRGTVLKMVSEHPQALGWRVAGPVAPLPRAGFTCTNLSPEATRLARIRAVARYVFVLASSEAVFESPARGDVLDLGPYRAAISAMSTDSAADTTTLQLTFTAEGLRPEALRRAVEDRFERSSVVLVDASGLEIRGLPTPEHQVLHLREEAAARSLDYHFTFPRRVPRGDRAALKLRFHTDTHERPVTFELRDVRLP